MSKETKAAIVIGAVVCIGLIPWSIKISAQHSKIQELKSQYAILEEDDKWNRQRLWDQSVALSKLRHNLKYANEKILRLESGELEKTSYEKVREFHEKFGHPVSNEPGMIPKEREALRVALIEEEFKELEEAIEARDIIGIADALTDLNYVVYGAALEWGVPADLCFREVHRSNMSKLDKDGKPIYADNGKILKGDGYFPPNLKAILGIDE
jgi:predicted HAD superfamily Cof-like phosphohydrolase